MKTQQRMKDVSNKSAKAAQRQRLKPARHDWSVRATRVMPSGRYEVMVYDGDLPHSAVWLPTRRDTVLSASQTPDFASEAEALAAYEQAPVPTLGQLQAIDWLTTASFRHLLRLAAGVEYGL